MTRILSQAQETAIDWLAYHELNRRYPNGVSEDVFDGWFAIADAPKFNPTHIPAQHRTLDALIARGFVKKTTIGRCYRITEEGLEYAESGDSDYKAFAVDYEYHHAHTQAHEKRIAAADDAWDKFIHRPVEKMPTELVPGQFAIVYRRWGYYEFSSQPVLVLRKLERTSASLPVYQVLTRNGVIEECANTLIAVSLEIVAVRITSTSTYFDWQATPGDNAPDSAILPYHALYAAYLAGFHKEPDHEDFIDWA